MVYPFAYRSRGFARVRHQSIMWGIHQYCCTSFVRLAGYSPPLLPATRSTHVSDVRGNVMHISVRCYSPSNAALARTSSVRPASACPWGSIWVRWREGSKGPENSSALPLLLNVGPIVWPIAFAGGVYRDGTRSVRYEGKTSLLSTKHQ